MGCAASTVPAGTAVVPERVVVRQYNNDEPLSIDAPSQSEPAKRARLLEGVAARPAASRGPTGELSELLVRKTVSSSSPRHKPEVAPLMSPRKGKPPEVLGGPPSPLANKPGAEPAPAGTERDQKRQEALATLDEVFAWCCGATDEAPQDADSISLSPQEPHNVFRGPIVPGRVVEARAEVAELCLSRDPVVSRRALVFLRRILENQPVGHPDVACGLFALIETFIEQIPPNKFSNMSLDVSARMIQCLFLLLEAVRAEHLIGNLPSISQEQRESVWAYADALSDLNVKAKEGGLLDESADVVTGLWLDAMVQAAKRLKTPVSKLADGLKAVAGTAGAAIKLYQGDIAAGLAQLKDTFKRNTLLVDNWFDELVVLRKLVSDAVQDEGVFRQLKWTLSNSPLLSSVSDDSTEPRFLMHVILCLERLVLEGSSEFIREESFQLLTSYALCPNKYIQLTAAKALQALCEAEESEKVQATAQVVLRIIVTALMSQSDYGRVRQAAERIQRQWDADRGKGTVAATRARAGQVQGGDSFRGYSSVIASLIIHLNEGADKIEHEETLMSMASKVTSHHAARVTRAVREAVYLGDASDQYLRIPNKDTGLTPVHQAAKSGVQGNLEWMLASSDDAEDLAVLKTDTGLQPIHMAGSTEILHLLLRYKAGLDARDDDSNTVLHTLTKSTVLQEAVRLLGTPAHAGLGIGLQTRNERDETPLLCPRNPGVTDFLLEMKADANERAGPHMDDMPALSAAANADNADVCQVLIDRKADVNALDSRGKTALHFTGPIAVHCLLATDLRKHVNAKDVEGQTPLHNARDPLVMRALLECRADVNAKANNGETPLVTTGDTLAKAECLLQNGADPTAKTQAGDSFFLDACLNGRHFIASALLQDDPEELLKTRGPDGRDAIHNAALTGDTSMLYMLHELGASLTTFDLEGNSCYSRSCRVARFCIAAKADPNLRNCLSGATPLMTMYTNGADGTLEDVKEVIDLGCDPCAVDDYGQSVFTMWAGAASRPFLQLLLEHQADPLATEQQHPAVVAWAGSTAATYREGPDQAASELSWLLELRCDLNGTTAKEHRSALAIAALLFEEPSRIGGYTQPLEALLAAKADPLIADVQGCVPLHYAVQNEKSPLEAVQRLMDNCPRAAWVHNAAGDTPVEIAERLGLDDVTAYLKKNAPTLAMKIDGRASIKLEGSKAQDVFLLVRLGREQDALAALKRQPDLSSLRDPASGDTILHAAVQGGCLGLVRAVLERAPGLVNAKGGKANSDLRDYLYPFPRPLRFSPLHFLGTMPVQPTDAEAIARCLVQAKADPHEEREILEKGSIAIDAAAFSPGVLKVLLEAGVSPDTSAPNGWWWIWEYVRSAAVVRTLLEFSSSINAPESVDFKGNALHILAGHQGAAALRALLEHIGDDTDTINAATEDAGTTPLMVAARKSHLAVRALLLARADVGVQDKDGETALHLASGRGVAQTVKALLEAKADPKVCDGQERTVLHTLGARDKLRGAAGAEALGLLLAAGADLLATDQTTLPAALGFAGDRALLARVLEAKAPLDLEAKRSGLSFPLAAAATGLDEGAQCLALLQERGVDVLASKMPDLLHSAAAKVATLAYVLELMKADPASLLRAVTCRDDRGDTVFHKVAANDPPERDDFAPRMRILLATCREVEEVGLDLPRIVNMRNNAKRGPIDGNTNCASVRLLLEAAADPTRALAFFGEGEHSNLPLVDLLLEAEADINALAGQDATVRATPLQQIVRSGDLYLVKEWVKRGADIQKRDASGDSAILYADMPHVVTYLQERQLDVNFHSPVTGDTLLHKLSAQGRTSMVKHVLVTLQGKAPSNSQGQSPLHIAAGCGHVDTAEFLVSEGFDIEGRDREGQTPLHSAVRGGHIPVAVALLNAGARVNALNDSGETPLYEAVRVGSYGIYQVLLEQKADPLVSSANKYTMLHTAAKLGHVRLAEVLLQTRGLDVNQQTTDFHLTALHLAVKGQRLAVLQMMMQDPRVNRDLVDKKGETALTMAAEASAAVLRAVVSSRPCDVALLRQPLLRAVECGSREGCEFLVQECSVKLAQCVDESHNNALHLVARNGDVDLGHWMIEVWGGSLARALEAKNADGMAPRDVAEVRDHDRVLRLLNVAARRAGSLPHAPSGIETSPEPQRGSWCGFASCCDGREVRKAEELVVESARAMVPSPTSRYGVGGMGLGNVPISLA